jgi:hypothetical protein
MPQNQIPLNHTTTGQKEEDQLDDPRNTGKSSCNPGDGTDQRVQSLMFMMMIYHVCVYVTRRAVLCVSGLGFVYIMCVCVCVGRRIGICVTGLGFIYIYTVCVCV